MYEIDSEESVFEFRVTHLGLLDVVGSFEDAGGTVEIDPTTGAPIRTSIEIRSESISTDDKSRDDTVRSDEFLDVDRFPSIGFESSSIEQTGTSPQNFRVVGSLTIAGVTKQLDAIFSMSETSDTNPGRLDINSQFVLNRADYGLKFGRIMNAMVGDTIDVTLRIVAIRED